MKKLELTEYLMDTVEDLLRILREQNRTLAEYDSVYADHVEEEIDEAERDYRNAIGERR